MADTVSPEVRSRIMASIRGRNTKPEMTVRKGLHALGFRYSLHSSRFPGKPDIVLTKYKAVIFVHGCFWHGHHCPAGKLPDTRRQFWEIKIGRTRERDSNALAVAERSGWRCLVVWECSINRKSSETVAAVAEWLRSGKSSTEI